MIDKRISIKKMVNKYRSMFMYLYFTSFHIISCHVISYHTFTSKSPRRASKHEDKQPIKVVLSSNTKKACENPSKNTRNISTNLNTSCSNIRYTITTIGPVVSKVNKKKNKYKYPAILAIAKNSCCNGISNV